MRLIDKRTKQEFEFTDSALISTIKDSDVIDKQILDCILKFLKKKEHCSLPGKHHFLAYLPMSSTLDDLIKEDRRLGLGLIEVDRCFGGKCTNEDDTTNHSWTRHSFAEFVFALNEKMHDATDLSTRNSVYEQVKFIVTHDWTFGSRFVHHTLMAVKNNNIRFSKKQSIFIEDAMNKHLNSADCDDFPVDSDDEHEMNSPGICPDCNDNPAGDYLTDYRCDACQRQEEGAVNMYLENNGW